MLRAVSAAGLASYRWSTSLAGRFNFSTTSSATGLCCCRVIAVEVDSLPLKAWSQLAGLNLVNVLAAYWAVAVDVCVLPLRWL